MRLRITTPPGRAFCAGWAASVFLDDVDVSRYVQSVVLTCDATDGPVRAEIKLFTTEVDVDVAAVIIPLLAEADDAGNVGSLGGLEHGRAVRLHHGDRA